MCKNLKHIFLTDFSNVDEIFKNKIIPKMDLEEKYYIKFI